jgi:hypothetical protein
MNGMTAPVLGHHAAVIWVDGWHALVARKDHDRRTVAEVDREADPVADYLLRVAREADDCDRLMIIGPPEVRLAFEREYVSLYRRPDRLIDAETAASASPRELLDRLSLLDWDERQT